MGLLHSIMGLLFSKCAPSAELGFDEYFDPPLKDGLKCCICHHGLRNPKQTHCGHRFCESCITESIRNKGRKCPVSGCEHFLGNSEPYPDNFASREILTSNVRCRLRTHDCPWKGPLQDLEYHLKTTCLFTSVKCDCGCEIPRGDLQKHVVTGCPRTMDWRLEAIFNMHNTEDEVSQLPLPVEEMDSSSFPEQITGVRHPVEHHQGKELRDAGNESKQSDSAIKPKNPLPYQREDGKKVHGFDPPPELKDLPANQKEGGNEANSLGPAPEPKEQLPLPLPLYPPAEPNELMALQNENGNEANKLEPPAEPNKPLAHQREDGDKANGLNLPVEAQGQLAHQKEDGHEGNRLHPPVEPKESMMYRKEDSNEVNGLDPPGKSKGLLAHQMEDNNEAILLDGPAEPKEPLACQKIKGNEVYGLDLPAVMEKGNKAIALDPSAELTEPLMNQKEDANEVRGLDHSAEPRESLVHQMKEGNKATVLDVPADRKEPLMYQKKDGDEVNGLEHPTEPKESLVHQMEEGNHAIALPLMYQKEEELGANELRLFVKPKEPDLPVHPKEDGCEASRLDPSAKPTEPSPCQREDANGLDVSSQNNVPSFI